MKNMNCKLGLNKYTLTKEPSSTDAKLEDDYVVKTIGAFGVWQAIVCTITALTKFIIMANVMSIAFLAPRTNFICAKFKENMNITVVNSTCYESCLEYTFYETFFEETLITSFNLICERRWLASFTQSATMFGLLLGVSLFGWISDRFGRRIAFILSALLAVVFMMAASFAPTYWTFTSFRFFAGVGSGGLITLSVVISMEMVGPKYISITGSCVFLADGVAVILLSVIAYYTPTWNVFILVTALLSLMLLIAATFVSETPRWLIAHNEEERAVEMLTKVAKFNNLSTAGIRDVVKNALCDLKRSGGKEIQKLTYIDVFKTRKLAVTTISLMVVWLVGGICFFGIHQHSTMIGTNALVMSPILGVVETIASIIGIFVNKFIARRISITVTFSVIAAAMLVLVFIPEEHWGCILASAIGQTAASLLFSIIYVQANEIYSTPLRNMGIGLISAGSKIGAMIAPFIANTKPDWVSFLIFGILPLLAVGFCLVLPETKGKKLQDTID